MYGPNSQYPNGGVNEDGIQLFFSSHHQNLYNESRDEAKSSDDSNSTPSMNNRGAALSDVIDGTQLKEQTGTGKFNNTVTGHINGDMLPTFNDKRMQTAVNEITDNASAFGHQLTLRDEKIEKQSH